MSQSPEFSLAIRGLFDNEQEAVGLDAFASEAFDQGDGPDQTRARIEICAAITAKANLIAADVIGRWPGDDQSRSELFDHFTQLKEKMLNDLIEAADATPADPS